MLKRQYGIRTALTTLVFACLLQSQLAPRLALAAGTAALTQQAVAKQIGLLENRFFSRQYPNDPEEKRLERLELMVFGGTQDGDNGQRLARLQKAVVAHAERPAVGAPTPKQGGDMPKTAQSSAQYTALNTLEWRALKKTYPQDSLDQRLARLEKKLFGADSPSMAYADRVDRLKRTLGVGVTIAQQPSAPLGPAPKARPHGQYAPQFGFGMPPMAGILPGMGGGMFGGEDGDSFGFGLPSGLNNMFRDMERQMEQLQQMPPGSYSFDPKSGSWIEQNTGKQVKPFGKGGQAAPGAPALPSKPKFNAPRLMPTLPPWQQSGSDSALPPYSDPNSI